jgi:pimeloyl-ACP methyl ester carboxylesterase
MRPSTTFVITAIVWMGSALGLGAGISAGTAAPQGIAGKWLGIIRAPGTDLRIAFEISQSSEGGYAAVLHSIDQGVMNVPMSTVTLDGDRLRLELKSAFAYEGRLLPDGNTIEGNWVQGGSTPLVLRRVDKIPELNRPQTPRKPYPYREEEVAYENPKANIHIAGTLTIPQGEGPFPAVLLISGSGPADRDESILGHKPFLVLADHLTRQGIAVLRVDKRGCGKTAGTLRGSGMEDFASDALAGVAYLKNRSEVDAKKIGLIGHSEGGSVAPMVAVQSPDVSYIVLLGAQGVSFYDILVMQDGTEAKAAGKTDEQVELIRGFSRRFYTLVLQSQDASEIERETKALYATLTDAEKNALDWPNLGGTLSLSWALRPGAREALKFDVRPYLRQVRCPVLALNGGKDSQVPPKENLGGIEQELQAGGNRNYTRRELPGLNHLFQTCNTGAFAEYVKIEETMSPLALQAVSDWILAQTSPRGATAP